MGDGKTGTSFSTQSACVAEMHSDALGWFSSVKFYLQVKATAKHSFSSALSDQILQNTHVQVASVIGYNIEHITISG
jgi:hypothetical protein